VSLVGGQSKHGRERTVVGAGGADVVCGGSVECHRWLDCVIGMEES
jgi:hypothetical protein